MNNQGVTKLEKLNHHGITSCCSKKTDKQNMKKISYENERNEHCG